MSIDNTNTRTPEACIPEGWTLVAAKALSDLPGDAHLRVVVAVRARRGYHHRTEFVTWVVNLQDGGCYGGAYWPTLLDAAQSYAQRGVEEGPKVWYESAAWR